MERLSRLLICSCRTKRVTSCVRESHSILRLPKQEGQEAAEAMGSGKHDTMQTTEVVRKNNKVVGSRRTSSHTTTQDQHTSPCPKDPDSSYGAKKTRVTNKSDNSSIRDKTHYQAFCWVLIDLHYHLIISDSTM